MSGLSFSFEFQVSSSPSPLYPLPYSLLPPPYSLLPPMTGSLLPPNSDPSSAGRMVLSGRGDLTPSGGAAIHPLAVTLTSSGQDEIPPGEIFELGVTIQNQGAQDAVIDVWIDNVRSDRGRSPLLSQWCELPHQRLALGPGQSGEAVFIFQIPGEALPDQFTYDLMVDSTSTYPQLPPHRERLSLQVLPAERRSLEANQPTFLIQPSTRPAAPAKLRPGVPLMVEIWVDNRSERVDRFHLSHLGIPLDWQPKVTYPRATNGPGLILEASSLGLNPGDRGRILLEFTPPDNTLAGSYVPTLRLHSQNNRDLNMLGLIYIQVEPIYLLQPTLQILRNQVRRQPALFEIQLVNEGNTDRTLDLTVENLDEPNSCRYVLKTENGDRSGSNASHQEDDTPTPVAVCLSPQSAKRLRIEALPQRWWRRPLFGAGRFLNFRVDLEDVDDHPLTLRSLQGNVIWLPRPWWQFLLAVLTVAGAIAALIFLIWWVFFRPPLVPRILSFEPQDSRYSSANGDSARVNWQIEHPERIQSLKITGYDSDGLVLSGPFIYELGASLPSALEPFCSVQDTLLWCENVETGARQPGTYQFELTVIPKGRQPETPIAQQTNPVVIDNIPQPQIVDFFASELIYLEAGALLTVGTDTPVPPVTEQGVQLNWIIDHPRTLETIKLVGRDAAGKILGTLWYDIQPGGGLPPELAPWCRIGEQLFCENVPTPVFEVGEYQFDLTAIPVGVPESEIEPITSEIITIQPQGSQILSFQINGEDVRAKHQFPITQAIVLSWVISGGSTTTAILSPVPGDVPLAGSVALPNDANPGSTTFTLQVNDGSGDTFTRSVTIETFDPNPSDPNRAIADAMTDAVERLMSDDDVADTAEEPALGTPDAADPDVISPSESPPRFGR